MGDTTDVVRLVAGRASLRRAAARSLSLLFVATALAFGAAAILPQRDRFADALTSVGWQRLGASACFCLAGVVLSAKVWTCAMRAVGARFDEARAERLFFATQVGKYLPGMLWPYLAQLRFAERFNISRGTMLVGQGVFLCVHVVTGALLAATALPLLAYSQRVPDAYMALMLPAVGSAALLHPALLTAMMRRIPRLTAGSGQLPVVHGRLILRAAGLMMATWLFYGAGLASLLLAMSPGSVSVWALSVGGFAFAWVVGFLVIIAPAGAGAREIVLAASLTTVVTPVQAAAVAVLSRVVMTAIDLVLGAVSAIVASCSGDRTPTTADGQESLMPPQPGRESVNVR